MTQKTEIWIHRLLVCGVLLCGRAFGQQMADVGVSANFLPEEPSARQQPQTAPPVPLETKGPIQETDAERRARERAEAEEQVRREERQRNFGVIPNFNTVLGGRVVPLSPGEKFNLVYHTVKDPYTFGIAFIGAGLGEAEDSHTGYHWGATGYFKRAGASYADNVSGALIGNAILPILLHQDPRYFRKGEGSAKSRILHSALSTVICKGDNGKTQFNVSNVAGNFLAGALSNVYYPSDETGIGLTIDNALVVTAEGVIGAQLLEFAPDLSNYVHKRREHHRMVLRQQQDAADAAARAAQPPVAVKP